MLGYDSIGVVIHPSLRMGRQHVLGEPCQPGFNLILQPLLSDVPKDIDRISPSLFAFAAQCQLRQLTA
jgi:hypothetical protein